MPDARHIVPCDCVGTCGLLVFDKFDWGDDGPDEFYGEFYSAGPWEHRLRHRLKAAWKLLRGKDHYLHSLAIDAAKARALRDWLIEHT